MDYSKLPKLSQTPPPPPAEPDAPSKPSWPAETAPIERAGQAAAGPEAFVSIAIGVLLLLMAPGLIKFLINGDPGGISDEAGQPMRYVDSVFFQGDLALTAFALVLIVEGLVIAFVRRPALVLAALALTVLATILNLLFVVNMQRAGYGLQILSALAVIFGIYIALFEWRVYRQMRASAMR
jgi:hypothetical protein